MIELGDRAKCTITGIKSETLKDGLTLDVQWFDDPQVEMVDKAVVSCGKDPGGPTKTPKTTMPPSR